MIHLNPVGLLWGKEAAAAVAAGEAGWLAGGPVAFTALEVIERAGEAVGLPWRSFRDLQASTDMSVAERLKRIEAPRPPLFGRDFSQACIMGVVNVTPDSFSDGGLNADPDSAIAHGLKLAAEGADFLDVGGESTRPFSEPVPLEIERARSLPVVKALASQGHLVSIDTRKAQIMREAVAAGARILNDVSALGHEHGSLAAARELGVPVVVMHSQGDPKNMQVAPRYAHAALDIFDWFEARITECEAAGLDRSLIIADPGIGFGKTATHNLELLGSITLFHGLGVPLLVGASRKAFIGRLTGESVASRRASGSVGAAIAAVAQGVQIVRVHDVGETRQALAVWHAAMHTRTVPS